MNVKQDARAIFDAAVSAVQPAQLLPSYITKNKEGIAIGNHFIPFHSLKNLYVIGAGKASAAMAVATEIILGDYITGGVVVTKYGHALPCNNITILEGAHPVPDVQCVQAVEATIALLQKVTKEDIVICLISGGASALWCDVPPGLTLQSIQNTFNLLLKSGATIQEMNTVRKHLSAIKGGQLIKHCKGAAVFTLLISDVPGDDISMIASGPTVGDTTTFKDAYTILTKYQLFSHLPDNVQTYIRKGVKGNIADTPKPGNAIFQRSITILIGNNAIALQAAATKAKDLGYTVQINSNLITGDAEKAASALLLQAQQYAGSKPACIIQGGEITVTVTGSGKGGRNQHFVLAALYEISKNDFNPDNVLILSGGTDGTDGPTGAAGAMGDKATIQIAAEKMLSITNYLQQHDAYSFFKQTDGLIVTGATQTNVMDIMLAILY